MHKRVIISLQLDQVYSLRFSRLVSPRSPNLGFQMRWGPRRGPSGSINVPQGPSRPLGIHLGPPRAFKVPQSQSMPPRIHQDPLGFNKAHQGLAIKVPQGGGRSAIFGSVLDPGLTPHLSLRQRIFITWPKILGIGKKNLVLGNKHHYYGFVRQKKREN